MARQSPQTNTILCESQQRDCPPTHPQPPSIHRHIRCSLSFPLPPATLAHAPPLSLPLPVDPLQAVGERAASAPAAAPQPPFFLPSTPPLQQPPPQLPVAVSCCASSAVDHKQDMASAPFPHTSHHLAGTTSCLTLIHRRLDEVG